MNPLLHSFRFFLVFHLLGVAAAFGYGAAGHEAVGNVAAHYLQGTRAEREIQALLKPKENLASAATWADRAKIPEEYLTNEMKDFVAANPEHHTYHYCDIPFQEKAYREGSVGAGPNDIVHVMRDCIEILQSPEDVPANPRHLTKRMAFLLLAHLVGDIHQPLHVGTSYVDEHDRFVNPNAGEKGQEDAGANYFKLTRTTSLHGYWDTITVKNARARAKEQSFADYLVAQHPPQPDWKMEGPPVSWPEKWATQTLALSANCFKGIAISNRVLVPADEKRPEHFEWKVTLSPEYADPATDVVERELARAGYDLAELLKTIWPDGAPAPP